MQRASSRLSTLWVFATLNYLYCDVVTLMNPQLLKGYLAGHVGNIDITQGFLLAAGVLVEIPMVMVLLSRLLSHRAARRANIIAGGLMTIVQIASLFAGSPALYYVFFSVIELGATAFIVWQAWRWREEPLRTNTERFPEFDALAVHKLEGTASGGT